MRRIIAKRRRRIYADVWPIDPVAGTPPKNWPGWPDGKKFAFVLTHDVESQKGLDRVRQLADLEESLGFRSSFNFIPEGEYRVSKELRDELTSRGFEVGVHDLHHDGRLYRSERHFKAAAAKINQYVREWDAKGFRSGLMHHNLEWLHYLDVEYDASTFDTDPFEPQPDDVQTIFPFWVEQASGHRYVELPYTLVQDFNLFFILEERGIAVWKQKLDWIASRGGMALLNTHPDYFGFDGNTRGISEFPEAYYRELLIYVRDRYARDSWSCLPREVYGLLHNVRVQEPAAR